MKTITNRVFLLFSFLFLITNGIFAQKSDIKTPIEQELLNRLQVLTWPDQNADKVTIKIRVHSGSAFDPVGKDGTMKLLTRVMFPKTGLFEDFEENFEGSLKVDGNHDYIEVEAVTRPDKFVEALDLLAGLIRQPTIDKDSTKEAKQAGLEFINAETKKPVSISKMETAKRLYGDFPYGRPVHGTPETLEKVDFADLIFVNKRFFSADNATVTISGNVSSRLSKRAARRLLGGWQKSDRIVPPNFTLPDEPDTAQLVVNTDFGKKPITTFAVEAVSRRSDDYYKAYALKKILDKRLKEKSIASVEYEALFLRGYFRITTSGGAIDVKDLHNALTKSVTKAEADEAKFLVRGEFLNKSPADHYLDKRTYKLKSFAEQRKQIEAIDEAGLNAMIDEVSKRKMVRVVVMPLEGPMEVNDEDPKDPR